MGFIRPRKTNTKKDLSILSSLVTLKCLTNAPNGGYGRILVSIHLDSVAHIRVLFTA
jgi:hypothetical protein